MKRGTALQVSWLGLAAAVLLAAALSPGAPAQSGRKPAPTPTPTPAPAPAPKAEEPKFVPDPNAEKYRLLFATRYPGSFSYRDADELQLIRRAAFDNFAEHLNRAGGEGYRVITSLRGDPAVVALGRQQFEYAWTETASDDQFFKRGFAGTYAQLAKKGFRLTAHALLYGYCSPVSPGRCDYRDFFLFERRKGDETPREFKSVDTERGVRVKGQSDEGALTAAVNAKRAEGFYPAQFLSKSEIVLEREPPEPALAEADTEVRVLRSSNFWERDELPKKVNELARQGFRLALADYEIAVMYRRAGETAPLGYVWVKGSGKDFEKELARLQAAGAVFRMTYPDSNGTRRILIFEQGAAGDGAPREYRVLRFELQTQENSAEQVLETRFGPTSAETQKELSRLAAEGFAVLALFDADKFKFTKAGKGREAMASEEFGVLLERKP